MGKAKFRLKKLDTYSVVVTFVIMSLLIGIAFGLAWWHVRRVDAVTQTPPGLIHLCNCPMIPAKSDIAYDCRC